ncbi:Uncharacterised protein [Candidatus Gugararchaeum adminiculabundum]|nr:Uncharacterised protein [Candidatus Gugararchaeum adminiculabundum]
MDKKNGITLIIGGNASGKTRLLKELREIAGGNAEYYNYRETEDLLAQEMDKEKFSTLLVDEPFITGQIGGKPIAKFIMQLAKKRKVVVATSFDGAEFLFSAAGDLKLEIFYMSYWHAR